MTDRLQEHTKSRNLDPNALGIHPLARIEEIMSHLGVTGVGLEQLKLEATGCKDGSKCDVELTIGEARSQKKKSCQFQDPP